jgi:hypothetical protein
MQSNNENAPSEPTLDFSADSLPIAPLESLRFRLTQTIDSLVALQNIINYGQAPAMPSWPDIMAKYTLLLAQTHSLSAALAGLSGGGTATSDGKSVFGTLALPLREPLSDQGLEEVHALERTAQTLDVRAQESARVRRSAGRMRTRGALGLGPGVLGVGGEAFPPDSEFGDGPGKRRPKEEDVLAECESIRNAHDARVERAVRAVAMLREKYDFKARVQVDQEEPEELDWDPRLGGGAVQAAAGGVTDMLEDGADDESGEEESDSDGGEDGEEGNGVEEFTLGMGTGMTPASSEIGTPSGFDFGSMEE